ncbi:hypothetical protein ACO0LF_10630 [Undibacterium sp. Di27W]|uniref:hypothetical protein n=1 Tax=Undibacterium sp. Di27W TaxID=3413036 RepID=UPI003BF3340E
MSIFLYESILILSAVVISVFVGRSTKDGSGWRLIFFFGLTSVLLAFIVTAIGAVFFTFLCSNISILCVEKDDKVLGAQSLSLIAIPLYILVMMYFKNTNE